MRLDACRGVVMKRPCVNCPFLREGGIRLTEERARELAENAVSRDGVRFYCHKSYYGALERGEMENVRVRVSPSAPIS